MSTPIHKFFTCTYPPTKTKIKHLYYLTSLRSKVDKRVRVHYPAIVGQDILSSLGLYLLPTEILITTYHMEVPGRERERERERWVCVYVYMQRECVSERMLCSYGHYIPVHRECTSECIDSNHIKNKLTGV